MSQNCISLARALDLVFRFRENKSSDRDTKPSVRDEIGFPKPNAIWKCLKKGNNK